MPYQIPVPDCTLCLSSVDVGGASVLYSVKQPNSGTMKTSRATKTTTYYHTYSNTNTNTIDVLTYITRLSYTPPAQSPAPSHPSAPSPSPSLLPIYPLSYSTLASVFLFPRVQFSSCPLVTARGRYHLRSLDNAYALFQIF